MKSTIEKKVKTKKWYQCIFQIVGVAVQVEEGHVIPCQSLFIHAEMMFYNEYPLNSTNTRLF